MENDSLYLSLSKNIFNENQFKEDFKILQKNALSNVRGQTSFEMTKRLLQSCAIFSLSEDEKFMKLAYKISIFILETNNSDLEIYKIIEIILIRLGNFPAIIHLLENGDYQDLFGVKSDKEDEVSLNLWKEFILKKEKNFFSLNEVSQYFTDFQSDIFNLLISKKNISFSAPTSAGKSFILSAYISKIMSECLEKKIVYVVPTRALVNQVQKDMISSLNKFKQTDVKIFSLSQDILELDMENEKKAIFIVTQERLETILSNLDQDFKVDLLIIDEAQKIGDDDRGIRLESVIRDLIELNESMQSVFIAPFAKNPEKFKELFGIDLTIKKSSISPVSQNIFLVNFENRKVDISLYSNEVDETLDLYGIDIPRKVAENYNRKLWVLDNLLEKDSQTIIYCDAPIDCKRVAESINSNQVIDEEVSSAINFISEHIHKDYDLIELMKKGVAFHYSRMPSFVKLYIEELFKSKKIKNICATSTLVEGVNLPAKNIIIYKPKKGRKLSMDNLTFLNLVGRAGRLTKDFYGNIYCIDIDKWESCKDAIKGKDYLIESASEKTLNNKIMQIKDYLRRHDVVDSDVQTLVVRFIINQIKSKKIEGEINKIIQESESLTDEDLESILGSVKEITESLELDPKTILKNPAIDPRIQNKMYLELKKMDRSNWSIPVNVYQENFYSNLEGVYKIISEVFLGEQNKAYKYFTNLTSKWIREDPYKEILLSKLTYSKGENYTKKDVNEAIEKLNSELEDSLRFKYSKYLKCYNDILDRIIYEEGLNIKTTAIHNLIERGASDKRTIALIKLGLSRSTSIHLKHHMPKNLESPNDCLEWIRTNLYQIKPKIPFIYGKELDILLGTNGS